MKTATYLSSPSGFAGDARLYRLDPPLKDQPWDDTPATEYSHVIVSAVIIMFRGPETYIFGADADGNVLDWGELPGSFQGGLDHEAALEGAGYEVSE